MTTVYSDDVTKDSVSSSLTALAERGLSSAAASMQSLADSLVAQAATSQSRADLFRSQIANLNEITASAYAAMQNANSASFDAALYARIEAAKVELGKAASYFDSALQAATIGQNIGALGKSIGAVVGAIDLLGALNRNSPQADVSKEAIVASIGLAVGMATAGLGLGTGIGAAVLTGLITKAMWDDFISPQLQGAGIDLTRPFWDALIEDWGIVDGVNAISRILGTDPDPLVRSVKYVPRTDPLVLDLDGDGFEITAVNRTPPILFDNNADTVKTATAWVNSDDGLLVLDRNGNGMIDSGRELFGDETVLADGSKASNGFTALASLDSNADGQFTALDTQFNAVRVWRDLNQDGVSQAGELKTLVASGITRIGLTASNVNQSYGDAQLQQTGTFTRADGSVGQAGSFLFATNSFMREFAPITISAAAAALPNIGGSGWARDLREAATQSPELIDIVNAARNATTRSGYKAAIDNLLREWGNDSSYHSFIDLALNDGYGLILSEPTNAQERGWMGSSLFRVDSNIQNPSWSGARWGCGQLACRAVDMSSGRVLKPSV